MIVNGKKHNVIKRRASSMILVVHWAGLLGSKETPELR